MGHKGVSKRKPKKAREDRHGLSNTHPGESSTVQSLMEDKGIPANKGSLNPLAGSKKSQKRH
jgi:hypothetical protein